MTFNMTVVRDELMRVALMGDLDINTVEEFKERLLREFEKENQDIVLDLKDLNYMDSTGLGAMMTIYKEVIDKDKEIRVENPKKNILKLFKITELDTIFNLED